MHHQVSSPIGGYCGLLLHKKAITAWEKKKNLPWDGGTTSISHDRVQNVPEGSVYFLEHLLQKLPLK